MGEYTVPPYPRLTWFLFSGCNDACHSDAGKDAEDMKLAVQLVQPAVVTHRRAMNSRMARGFD